MKVFIDTSAFYAIASQNDTFHHDASVNYKKLLGQHALITTSYLVVETMALLHSRGGHNAACNFLDSIDDVVEIVWVTKSIHDMGAKLYYKKKRDVSFVDCVSFAFMHYYHIKFFMGFDKHFLEEGFRPV